MGDIEENLQCDLTKNRESARLILVGRSINLFEYHACGWNLQLIHSDENVRGELQEIWLLADSLRTAQMSDWSKWQVTAPARILNPDSDHALQAYILAGLTNCIIKDVRIEDDGDLCLIFEREFKLILAGTGYPGDQAWEIQLEKSSYSMHLMNSTDAEVFGDIKGIARYRFLLDRSGDEPIDDEDQSKAIPNYLKTTLEMLSASYPDGSKVDLIYILRALYDYMSNENLSKVASLWLGEDEGLVLNEVYRCASINIGHPEVSKCIQNLSDHGYKEWVEEAS